MPRAQRWSLIALGCCGAALVVYLGWLVLTPDYAYSTWVNGWAVDAFEVLVAVLCLLRALVRGPGRSVALALGVGLMCWAIGDTLLTAQVAGGTAPPPLSVTDVFWLAFYPPAYVAVVLFVRRETRAATDTSWLDGTIAALGAAAVCAAFALQHVIPAYGASASTQAVNFCFPVGDLLLFALMVGSTAVLGGRRPVTWILLAAALALNALGDTFNLFESTVGSPHADAVFRALAWPTAGLLMTVALWIPYRPVNPVRADRPAGFLLPGLAAVAGAALLLTGSFLDVTTVALGLAAATLGAVGIRLFVSVRRLRTLSQDHRHQSMTDELTGLGNRRYLDRVLDDLSSAGAGRHDTCPRVAFLYVDLDRFKEVNDSFGHGTGDEVLRQLGPRLRRQLRNQEILVRLGGDEFGVLLVRETVPASVAVAERLCRSLEEPFDVGGMHITLGASIGIATTPGDAQDPRQLVRCADAAMYRAKVSQSSVVVFDPAFDDDRNPSTLIEELRDALDSEGLELHYQPQLDLRDGDIGAVEALVRWRHPNLGLIPPMKFIPLAEDAGLMPDLTRWVLDEALRQCADWRRSGHDIAVAINVSPSNLLNPGFVPTVADALSRHGVPADAVVLEITETTIISNFEHAREVIDRMRDQGLKVSIDDFGAGFTSLASLSSLAVDELKLDGTFITGLTAPDAGRRRDVVRATIELGHAVGLRVVAECIEDSATLGLLAELGCDVGQGYHIGRPVPATSLVLGARSTTAAAAAAPSQA